MPRPESPRSPSRFIYERSPSMLRRDNTNLGRHPPSEDRYGTPEDYDRFPPAQHPDFANHNPHEARTEAGPYSRDVIPYEQVAEPDDTNTVTSLSTNDSVPEHIAHPLNNPRFRCRAARHAHDICLAASQDFIHHFRCNIEQRVSEPQGNESRLFADRISTFDETVRNLYRSTHVTASLTTNTTGICSILWAKGNALQMLSPDSVPRALEDMREVTTAAGDIARIFDIALERGDIHEVEVRNALQAGMAFCERLGDLRHRGQLAFISWITVRTELGH